MEGESLSCLIRLRRRAREEGVQIICIAHISPAAIAFADAQMAGARGRGSKIRSFDPS